MEKPSIHPWFDLGDVAPAVELKTSDDKPKPITRMAGRTAVLHVAGADAPVAIATAFSARLSAFADLDADVFIVRKASPVQNRAFETKLALDIPVLSDPPGALAHNFNLGDAATTLVFDRASRLIGRLSVAQEPDTHVGAALTAIETHGPVEVFRESPPRQAPVMLIPNVLSPQWCRWLMALHDQENEPSGFMQQTKGQSVLTMDTEVKVRRDHVIPQDSALERDIRHIFERRLIPEIVRVTHSPIQRHEAFKIVRYAAEEGGHFRPHRDNTSSATRTRRFAVTLNLNTGEYDGGHLVFPEYGDIGYRPGAGEAVVFSCSLLHEARPVTRGERYVLLAFLH